MRIRSLAGSLLATPRLFGRSAPKSLPFVASRLPRDKSRLPLHLAATATRRQHASVSASQASQLQFGQPVHETHPHILKPGEVTPGITAQEYFDRRARLAHRLPRDGVAILASAELKYRSGAVFYPFRQDSNFLYLTGFNEPESIAVIQKTGDSLGDYLFHLFVRPKNPSAEQWSGPWSGVQAAEDVFNADRAGDINKAERLLEPILRGASKLYTDVDVTADGCTTTPGKVVGSAARASNMDDTAPLAPLLNSLRVVKSPAEIACMRHAGQVSGRALTEAMRRPWTTERALHAFLDHSFTGDGCDGPAYVPVVAGGRRANMIHYVLNNAALDGEELVLVDAGGEYGTYITDITRTWPVSGRFSPAQRDLYAAVLRAQRKGVSLCRATSNMSLDAIHGVTEHELRNELTQLGFDTAGNGLDTLFPHHVGHYIGLDVHDCPGYGRNVALKPGHCVTIEPGVYVPDDERWPRHFRGMGIRIEDSICVDDDSPLVLTTEAVKEVVDIEALRG